MFPVLLSGGVDAEVLLCHVDAVLVDGELQLPDPPDLPGRHRQPPQDTLRLLEHLVNLQ